MISDLNKGGRSVVYRLLGVGDHFIAAAERAEQVPNVVDALSTAFQKVKDGRSLAGGGVVEGHDPVTAVRVERAQDTDTGVAVVTVEADWLILVRSTLNFFLHLSVEYCVTAGYLPTSSSSSSSSFSVAAPDKV